MKNSVLKFTFLALLAASVSGCVSGGLSIAPDVRTVDEDGNSKLMTESKAFESGLIKAFPDIPIPTTHRIDLERSVIFTSPNQTVGKIALEGQGDVDSIYRFFESQMISQGWTLVNAFQSSTSSLYFAKPGKFAAIIVEGTGKSTSRVFINVGPE